MFACSRPSPKNRQIIHIFHVCHQQVKQYGWHFGWCVCQALSKFHDSFLGPGIVNNFPYWYQHFDFNNGSCTIPFHIPILIYSAHHTTWITGLKWFNWWNICTYININNCQRERLPNPTWRCYWEVRPTCITLCVLAEVRQLSTVSSYAYCISLISPVNLSPTPCLPSENAHPSWLQVIHPVTMARRGGGGSRYRLAALAGTKFTLLKARR